MGVIPFSQETCTDDALVMKRVDDEHTRWLYENARVGVPICEAAEGVAPPPVRARPLVSPPPKSVWNPGTWPPPA